MSEIPEVCVLRKDGKATVFFVDKGTCHLRHGTLRTVREGIAFVAVTSHEVVGVDVSELVPGPRFFQEDAQ